MKKWIAFVVIFFAALSVKAQYADGPDRYFYDEEFDWRWDVRVRISDGIRSGYLTHREANRLYKRLENIERKEWAFQSDGYYNPWEQDEIWMDVVSLNRSIGLELTDWDRRYYGYTGVIITGPLHWYFGPSYDFYRFDKRGYGSIRVGYVPRNYYPVKHVYYTHRNNYTSHWNNRPSRTVTPSRSTIGSRGNPVRSAAPARSAAPTRAAVPTRSTPSARVETSRAAAPAARTSSARVETSRAAAPATRTSSARVETSRAAAPAARTSSARPASSVETKSGARSSAASPAARSGGARATSGSRGRS